MSTETVKKAVGITKKYLKFNKVNKIKHYLIIFKKDTNIEDRKFFLQKANYF
ncbi:hypothetical protein D104_09480 [Marinomonas profundimaris]|uniref:Uncharacterized protein n=1 Tax=Marinomonas profundimaris TaxID=1208321 RepID=W1RT48_9GAMM|nr:hypothetical protein D104_09480 [Marinomonas profundimaris]